MAGDIPQARPELLFVHQPGPRAVERPSRSERRRLRCSGIAVEADLAAGVPQARPRLPDFPTPRAPSTTTIGMMANASPTKPSATRGKYPAGVSGPLWPCSRNIFHTRPPAAALADRLQVFWPTDCRPFRHHIADTAE